MKQKRGELLQRQCVIIRPNEIFYIIFSRHKDLTIDRFVIRPFFAQKSLKSVSKRGGQ